MTRGRGTSGRGAGPAQTGPEGFENPLDFIAEDHMREREVCVMLDRVARAEDPPAAEVVGAIAFLSEELPLHLADEEQDLFPTMRRRCKPEDEIGKAVDRLLSDHAHAQGDTPRVVALLSRVRAGGKPLSSRDCQRIRTYARHARQHLILENAIILPLARLRLTRKDLATLRDRMIARRRPDGGPETRHAH